MISLYYKASGSNINISSNSDRNSIINIGHSSPSFTGLEILKENASSKIDLRAEHKISSVNRWKVYFLEKCSHSLSHEEKWVQTLSRSGNAVLYYAVDTAAKTIN